MIKLSNAIIILHPKIIHPILFLNSILLYFFYLSKIAIIQAEMNYSVTKISLNVCFLVVSIKLTINKNN